MFLFYLNKHIFIGKLCTGIVNDVLLENRKIFTKSERKKFEIVIMLTNNKHLVE